MNLFVDTNIALDYLTRRKTFTKECERLFSLFRCERLTGWISSSQITDIIYILSSGGRRSEVQTTRCILLNFLTLVKVFPFSIEEANSALCLDWDDIEDACLYQCAKAIGVDCIITNNKSDFKKSRLPVFTPSEFFVWLKDEHGIDYDYLDRLL